MAEPFMRLGRLIFSNRTGDIRAELPFSDEFSFVFGASNTGKSFALESLDFMLGGNRELPDISERRPYDRALLEFSLSTGEQIMLERAMVGGEFSASINGAEPIVLAARHNKTDESNLSNWLLGHLGMAQKEIARDKSATKKPLSFRDLARICIVDETAIQSKTSPAESGDVAFAPLERNVFKYMLTGEDDSALVTILKPKDYATGRSAQVRLLDEMLLEVEAEIADSFPGIDDLSDDYVNVQNELVEIEKQMAFARDSSKDKLERKMRLVASINRDQQQATETVFALDSFEQLRRVYESDIARLESIEESGFLLGLNGDDCPVCGAALEHQVHKQVLTQIEASRAAAEIEIAKVRAHAIELAVTIEDTTKVLHSTSGRLQQAQLSLIALEAEISAGAPKTDDGLRRLSEIIPRRDRINRGLALSSRQAELTKQITELKKKRQVRQLSNVHGGLSTETANEFAAEVGTILKLWGFPGDCRTFFDLSGTFDLIIDGKRRKDNGKGVRAITHAAFKVALMTYCRTRGLPHPGFLIMDSPLITYRDPIASKGGELAADESILKGSDLRDRMFRHLGLLGDLGQVIVFDNIDPPTNADKFAQIQIFTNNAEAGRQGLL